MDRRSLLRGLGMAALAGTATVAGFERRSRAADADGSVVDARGSGSLRITKVRPILTAPQSRVRLVVVKVETSEPGLYGLGCATFNQRPLAVKTAVEEYLDPFCRGRNPDHIEDLWQSVYTSSYWRNGPVLNNALSGLDQALWDIKGKRAGMPVYQLLGGKSRFAVDCYAHASGRENAQVVESVQRLMSEGYRHIRIQLGGYGSPHLTRDGDFKKAGFGLPGDSVMEPGPYLRAVPKMFAAVREKCGDAIELLHDVHERVTPIQAVRLCKDLEPYRPFFVEDPFSPEDNGWFKVLRPQTSVPLAMGELFNNPHEWTGLITERLIDFIRVHLSQIGGLTPARKLAALAEAFHVRSAWHGPLDVSPVGHAANAHLDLAIWNFGIQEAVAFNDAMREVFPGAPTMKDGYMHVNEAPGWGVDLNEDLAKKFPLPEHPGYWEPVRRNDGTNVKP
ncbi:MAG: bifunctional D-altronate/D-mannonate dehydratase [Verrucomicrobiales bacterium]|nr:bifunctional D-altronate/D-mannonate dehydratase [Verrucomicrobiales bacterium]